MTPLFGVPPSNPSPYIDPRLFGADRPVPGSVNFFPSSVSPPEKTNDSPIDPALNNQYFDNDPIIFDNQDFSNDLALFDNQYFNNDPAILDIDNYNDNNGSSGGDIEAVLSRALQK